MPDAEPPAKMRESRENVGFLRVVTARRCAAMRARLRLIGRAPQIRGRPHQMPMKTRRRYITVVTTIQTPTYVAA